jgi:hypothetical protein
VLLEADRPEEYERFWKAFAGTRQAAIEEFPRYLAEKVHEIINVEFTSATTPITAAVTTAPTTVFPPGSGCRTTRSGSAARPPSCTPRWARPAWKRWTR